MTEPTSSAGIMRDVPPLSLRASFTPSSVDSERRTAELVWTTGAKVMRGFFERYYEELSLDPKHVRMGRLNNGAPLLANHDGSDVRSVIGVVESAKLEGKRGTAIVRFARSEDDAEADKIFRKVKDGILQNISVGYRVHKLVKVEGGDAEIPTYRAEDWEPFELSVVPMGADDGAGFRSTEASPNPCVFVTRKELSMNENQSTGSAPAPAPTSTPVSAVEEATRAAAEQRTREAERLAADQARATEAAIRQEREREVAIRDVVRRANLPDALADKLIREGASLSDVRAAAFDHLTQRSDSTGQRNHVAILAGEDVREKYLRGATASIIERTGHSQMIEEAKLNKRVGYQLRDVTTDGGEFRGMHLVDLARHALEMRGVSTRGLHGEALVRRALEFRGDSGMNTTSDFSILLESVVNKIFLGQYALAPVTWPLWCGKKSVQDFRTSTFYRPGTFGRLDSLAEGGEIKHKNIPDGAKATLTPATKANLIGISRRSIVNDDLGAFRDLAAGLGLAAAQTVEYDAYVMLTTASGVGANAPDGTALFTAGHGNIGNTGAMSVATLDSMRAKMALQKDVSGNVYLGLRPKVLVVPVELGGTATVFNDSSADPSDSKSAAVANKVKGLFDAIVDSPYLSAQSATRHYAFADPALYPACAVGFIDGQEAPRIDSMQSFAFDGVQMRVILDYGTAVIDHRPAATCAGA